MKVYTVYEKDVWNNNPVTSGNKIKIYLKNEVDTEIEQYKHTLEYDTKEIKLLTAEIDQKDEEIERLKKNDRCVVEAKEIYHKNWIEAENKIERLKHEQEMTKLTCDRVQEKYEGEKIKVGQLKKEKEWLIKQTAKTLNGLDDTYSEIYYRNYIKREMQQKLKENK